MKNFILVNLSSLIIAVALGYSHCNFGIVLASYFFSFTLFFLLSEINIALSKQKAKD
jgi:hypothetical protein